MMGMVYYPGYTLEMAKSSVCNGWHALLDEVFEKKPDHVRIVQVKEKWAGLRIYVDAAPMEFHDYLEEVEKRSMKICEFCGKPGRPVQIRGWWKTVCEACERKEKE